MRVYSDGISYYDELMLLGVYSVIVLAGMCGAMRDRKIS